MADNFGNTVHLGERDCSIQRRHQKLVEITPSLMLDDDMRTRMGEAAVRAAKAAEYTNAGTIEFLVDAEKNFLPSFGRVTSYYSPGGIGVRIDGAIYKDYVIPGFYDSLVVKLVVTGSTWDETVRRMHRSLDEFIIRGVKTTIPFLKKIMKDPDFKSGNFDTGYIDRKPELMDYKEYRESSDLVAAISAAIAAHHGL